MPITVQRHGISGGPSVSQKDADPYLDHAGENLLLTFFLPAGGQGTSSIEVAIGPDQFARIARLMVASDRQAAAAAFSAGVSELA